MLGAIILGLIAGIGFGCYFYAKERKEDSATGQSHTGTLGGVTFTRDRISYAGDSQPIAGANVEVVSSGQISRRFDWGNTITGAALLGPVGAVLGAGEKKTDDRELYLIVTGSQKQWAARLNPKVTPLAHGPASSNGFGAKPSLLSSHRRQSNEPGFQLWHWQDKGLHERIGASGTDPRQGPVGPPLRSGVDIGATTRVEVGPRRSPA